MKSREIIVFNSGKKEGKNEESRGMRLQNGYRKYILLYIDILYSTVYRIA